MRPPVLSEHAGRSFAVRSRCLSLHNTTAAAAAVEAEGAKHVLLDVLATAVVGRGCYWLCYDRANATRCMDSADRCKGMTEFCLVLDDDRFTCMDATVAELDERRRGVAGCRSLLMSANVGY